MFEAKHTGMSRRRRKEREWYRSLKNGYYHMSTDGWKEGFLFHTPAQYAYGMTVIGLLTLFFDIKIYSFTLMSNHVHILLSGTGAACLDAFDYLRKKLSARLVKDGYPPLPEDYWFKLVAVEDQEQMKNNFIYIDRNAYEQQICVPCGYPWSSSYLHYSQIGNMIVGKRADTFSKRALERLTGTREAIPAHWQFHPEYGLLPVSFIDNTLFQRLFSGPKEYEIRSVKDYESFVKVANQLDEAPVYSPEELADIVNNMLQGLFSGRRVKQLSQDETGRLVVLLHKRYNMSVEMIASALSLSERLVKQFLYAKDYGKQKSF